MKLQSIPLCFSLTNKSFWQHTQKATSIGWLSGCTHRPTHVAGDLKSCPSSVLGVFSSRGILAMLSTLMVELLGVQIPTKNNSCVLLSLPASYTMGLACQEGYIALCCKNSEWYDNLLRKISSSLFIDIIHSLQKHIHCSLLQKLLVIWQPKKN